MKPEELLKQHCTFNNPYEVYVFFGISRKKENDCTNSQEKVFREIIKHPEEIEKKYNRLKKSVLAYRDEDGGKRKFYIYVSVNPRDTRKAFFQLQKEFVITNEELMKQVDVANKLNRIDRYWYSCLMRPTSRAGRGLFLADIDVKDYRKDNVILELTKYTKIVLQQETKNGYHILIEPFNRNNMEKLLPAKSNYYEIKIDSLLFIEWVDDCDHLNESGHMCFKCKQLFPSCQISRYDLPSVEGTGCINCYPKII